MAGRGRWRLCQARRCASARPTRPLPRDVPAESGRLSVRAARSFALSLDGQYRECARDVLFHGTLAHSKVRGNLGMTESLEAMHEEDFPRAATDLVQRLPHTR